MTSSQVTIYGTHIESFFTSRLSDVAILVSVAASGDAHEGRQE